MMDFLAVENSKMLFDSTKEYFVPLKLEDCVIEISEKPMKEWTIHFTPTKDSLYFKRSEFARLEKSFIAIYTREDGTYFFFNDNITYTLELLDQKKYIFSDVAIFEEFDKAQLIKELKELKKLVNNY